MDKTFDLFHQLVYDDGDFMIEADYDNMFPQYYVYYNHTGEIIGTTNAIHYMPQCRLIMNDYLRRIGLPLRTPTRQADTELYQPNTDTRQPNTAAYQANTKQ